MKKLVIFDLDGTLLNTIADLAQSTNHALSMIGYPTHEESAYNFMVGNGINKLLSVLFPKGKRVKRTYSVYARNSFLIMTCTTQTRAVRIPGIPELLEQLQLQGLQIAVASNKYQAATQN